MSSHIVRMAGVVWIAASLSTTGGYVAAESPSPDFPSVEKLPAACLAAKANFRPLTQKDVQSAKVELIEAAGRLDKKLKSDGKNGENWRKYLLWEKFQGQLKSDEASDLDVLGSVYKRYAADHEGLALVWFLDVKEAIGRYRFLAASVESPKLKAAYDRMLDGLAEQLESYRSKPTAEVAVAIGRAVGQLQDARQAPELVAAVLHHFARPNLFADVSSELIAAAMSEDVDETAPVEDVILGTRIRGTGHTTGNVTAKLVPDELRGVVDITFLGITKTDNVGTNGPVRIYSNGVTRLGVCKRIWINAEGFSSFPSVAKAITDSEITDIHGGRMAERIAWNRAGQQQYRVQQIASEHAQQRVNRRVDDETAELLDRANDAFVKKFRQPLVERNLFPKRFDFSTTTEQLKLVGLQADRYQLAAPSEPVTELIEHHDIALRVHQSTINNLAADAVAGRTVRDETFRSVLIALLGKLPKELKETEDQTPWAITFAARQPVTVAFADGGFTVTVRGRRYYRGDESYPGMNVTAVYKFAEADGGFKAIRQGELQIFPPGFVPGSGKKLSAREVTIRTLLKRRFGKIFDEEFLIEQIELPERWSKVGKLQPVQLVGQHAWLTVAWRRVAQ